LHAISIKLVKEQVDEKSITVDDHLLKIGPSNIIHMLSIKDFSILMMSISENSLLESERF